MPRVSDDVPRGYSDGNGGLYIHRTAVEKAAWSIAMIVLSALLSVIAVIVWRAYDTVQDLRYGQIQMDFAVKDIHKQVDDNRKLIDDHEQRLKRRGL